MAMSGISVSAELKADLSALQADTKVFAIQLDIKNDAFVKTNTINTTGNNSSDFEALQGILHSRMPSYVFFRSPRQATAGSWICLFYCPSSAPVRQRMILASSINSLKNGFGASSIAGDFHGTTPAECSLESYLESFDEIDAKVVMTMDEIEREEAEIQSMMSAGQGPSRVAMDMPIEVDDKVMPALSELKDGKINTVVMRVNCKSETVMIVHSGDCDFSEVVGHMPNSKARFVVHNHSYTHEDQKLQRILFIYFCHPDTKHRNKMIYSTVKSKVIGLCAAAGITGMRNYEESLATDFTPSSVYDDLHPKVVEKKTFAKPQAKGRKGKGRRFKKKFQARR